MAAEPQPRKRGPMAKNWCFTDNNKHATPEDIQNAAEEFDNLTYICFGSEGEQPDKTEHWQGYAQLKKRIRLTGLQKAFPFGWHWEISRGTPTEARDYCYKECGEEELHEIGDFKEAGKGSRTDIHSVVKAIQEGTNHNHTSIQMDEFRILSNSSNHNPQTTTPIGATHMDLVHDYPVQLVKWRGGLLNYMADLKGDSLPEIRDVKVMVYWGTTGTGKTTMAVDHPSCYKMYGIDMAKDWWCSYNGETRLVIDEWYPAACHIGQLLKLLDKFKKILPIKNSHKFAEWNQVIITTNIEWPGNVYTKARQVHREALFRRIDNVVHFTKDWKEQTPVMWDEESDKEMSEDELF